MKIAFATTQSRQGSTMVGRIEPLARELAVIGEVVESERHDVHILLLDRPRQDGDLKYHQVGREPFTRTPNGKKRLRGIALIANMKMTALRTAAALVRLSPAVVIISKALPHNVAGVRLWRVWSKVRGQRSSVILDVDDFELTANRLISFTQRAAIHWAERSAANMADHIVAATPFLADHFAQLTSHTKPVTLVPTGLSLSRPPAPEQARANNLLYIGSLSVGSGHRVDLLPDILPAILAVVPNAKLHLAGSGDDVAMLKKSFADKGLDRAVVWHGRFQMNNLPQLLEDTRIIIDPIDGSIGNRAKSSFRTALAAAAGLPLVTSNIGIRPHFIPDSLHHRFFAKPADAADYADKIVQLLRQPLTSAETGNLIQRSRQYTWKELAKKYASILSTD